MTTWTASVVARVESASRLDAWSSAARSVVAPLVGAGRRRDVLTGRWLGHPFHPAAVIAPLGCWIGAVITDTIRGRDASPIARGLIGAGIVAAGPAIASGASDWLDTREAEQRVGTTHALVNSLALTAMAVSWSLRGRGHQRAGVVASSLGLGGALIAGFLGGHLAYARGVGVTTTAFQSGPDEWTAAIRFDDIADGRPSLATVDGVRVVVVAANDAVHVLENRCPHRGGPLAEGSVEDGCIQCPWHGSRFRLADGRVAGGPASIDQPAYDARVVDGWVEIRRTEHGSLRRAAAGT